MNSGGSFRLVEEPLGPAALEQPSREEWMALWESACRLPVPDYERATLRRLQTRPPA